MTAPVLILSCLSIDAGVDFVGEVDGELVEGELPFLDGVGPLQLGSHQRQPQQLEGGVLGREVTSVLDDLAQLTIHSLNGIGGVYDSADLGREREERDDPLPIATPGLGDHWVTAGPAVVEGDQRLERGLFGGRLVDRLQIDGHRPAVLVGDVLEAVADQMDNAGLNQVSP